MTENFFLVLVLKLSPFSFYFEVQKDWPNGQSRISIMLTERFCLILFILRSYIDCTYVLKFSQHFLPT